MATKTCEWCGGSGRESCVCTGDGDPVEAHDTCPACGGSGTIVCTECGGSGEIEDEDEY